MWKLPMFGATDADAVRVLTGRAVAALPLHPTTLADASLSSVSFVPPLACPQVLGEIKKCVTAFPNAFVRLIGFDPAKQVQVVSFLVHRPAGSEALAPADRFVVAP